MEQHKLGEGLLLNDDGNLNEAGYAFSLVKTYNRDKIKASKLRIKEWDYYYVGNAHRGLAMTIDDNGYMDLCSLTILDFDKPGYIEKSEMHAFSLGKRNLPLSSKEGDTVYKDKKVEMNFIHEDGKRHLKCYWREFGKNKEDLRVDVVLEETTGGNSMVIATPFEKKGHFYYNQKINNLRSSGYAKLGDEFIDLNRDSYGVLDWGRGVWTYQNTWYWSSLNSFDGKHTIGWNLGYGFGNTSAASENMLFVDDNVYKLDDVKFDIPLDSRGHDELMKPWALRSTNGDIDLVFTPKIIRAGGANVLLIKSIQNQVFGTFKGLIRINNGAKTFEIVNLPGFAEKVFNRW
ncbi:MAG: DUF2804 domain-containing protein [Bacilli bacterium]|jgi:hypothetical protein|nr:DUF2804 domain-containing protein [Bacilli bacterium]MCH4210953.1 DUF2804 domain-containing protein [Bacilli bacterium]MCH4228223.1 DUF2804 domain-containing protein [Bacilli bacterium]MCH4277423.1 DUF2804 domain-containing protein [Bacilli bacterium]MCI2055266.1 DUF2804 domain-containing protein [Bacilli bacterium]